MSSLRTAWLLNARGRITLHVCVRLEIRPVMRSRGICPIYQCAITGSERVFGCLDTRGSRRFIDEEYPAIPVKEVTACPDDLGEVTDDLAETMDDLADALPDSASSANTGIAA